MGGVIMFADIKKHKVESHNINTILSYNIIMNNKINCTLSSE